MFGFGKKRYSDTPWKTKDGQYKCQPDICPPDMCGSGKCPLDVYTKAMEALTIENDRTKALRLMATVLVMAPDFAEAWFNVGCMYGNMGDHSRARDAFKTALRYKPDYTQAKDALEKAEMHNTGGVAGVPSVRYMDVLDELLGTAVRKGDMLEKTFKKVPELMPYADGLSNKLIPELRKDAVAHGMQPDLIRDFLTVLAWSIYAGFGAVLEWNRDWPGLEKRGLLPKLTGVRGIYAMDEYVTQLYTGELYDTDAGIVPESCKEFSDSVLCYAHIAMSVLAKSWESLDQDRKMKYIMASVPELSKGCYMFGMALALEKVMR